jgi:hypothetical protein
VSNDDHRHHPQPNNDNMAFYLSGYLAGIDRGREQAEADMDRAWQPAYAAAIATARATPDAQHWSAVKARQIASCEAQKRDMVPWPDEATP